jgi:hypothetical protein
MKKLQSNFTTPEQSKRLLELGVPADSADCFYHEGGKWVGMFQFGDKISDFPARFGRTPCWSVGRLIEIYLLCAELKKPQMIFINEDVLMMDRMVNELCCMAESERLDFSKLEE